MNDICVVVPCYNSQSKILETIDSLISQANVSFEMVFVDDCSEDDTVKIIEESLSKLSNAALIKLDKKFNCISRF